MSEVNNPHNAFVMSILKQKKYAVEFLEQVLPESVSKNLDLTNLRYEDTSFVSGKFREFYSDILFYVSFPLGPP